MSSFPLNPAQKQAVEHQFGPLLVLAGAGSGKTRVITQRIVRLVERGIPEGAICALTFTNKAAGEMDERIAHALGRADRAPPSKRGGKKGGKGAAQRITISTFHSFGLMVLGEERRKAKQPFTIFDQGDCLAALKEVLRTVDSGRRFDVPAIQTRISNAKNAFLTAEELPDTGDPYEEITKIVYPKYQAALRSFSAYDFDDLVCEVARIFQARPDVLERWQKRYQFLLVDEYQDTNRAQLEVLRLLASAHKNICVVGDDDQSIYAWRGADVRNILEFEEHFPGATVVKLEQNYRSCRHIIAVANAVISKRNDVRHRKVLFTERPSDKKVNIGAAPTPEAEAAYVVREIKRKIREEGMRPKNFAVLYRSNGQAKLLEEQLRAEGVPYRLVGGQQFFERKEVKDVLSYVKLALNRTDEIALRRVINTPPRGVGDTSIERIALTASARGWTLWQAVERIDAIDGVSDAARAGCKELERVVGDLRRRLLVDRAPVATASRELLERVGMKRDIDAGSTSPDHAKRRWGNVEALMNTFTRRDTREAEKGKDPIDELQGFVHALTLKFEEGEEEAGDMVTLSTLHGSKGLEFEVVYLIGCEEGFLPHQRTLDPRLTDATMPGAGIVQASDIEEERRLFYVGVTRARDELTLTRCKHRMLRGKPMPRTPSRFLADVPAEESVEFEIRDQPAMNVAEMAMNANALLAALDALGK